MAHAPRILVVGSINMDLVIRAERCPAGGETIVGEGLDTIPGGKGANQAVAAARLGGDVTFVGRVGADAWGEELRSCLEASSVDASGLEVDSAAPTGVATILVEPEGENRIIVLPGANLNVSIDQVRPWVDPDRFDAVLLQLEIDLATVLATLRTARDAGIPVVLDAGPARSVDLESLRGVTILSPNESETRALTSVDVVDPSSADRAARQLEEATGAPHVVLKLGEHGAFYRGEEGGVIVEPFAIDPVDTTAAGDSFTAALALEYCRLGGEGFRGTARREAIRRANAAGALAALALGAQVSLPTSGELEAFLRERT